MSAGAVLSEWLWLGMVVAGVLAAVQLVLWAIRGPLPGKHRADQGWPS